MAIGPVTGCVLQSYRSCSHMKLKFRSTCTVLQTIWQCNQVIGVFVFVLADLFLLTVTFKLRERLMFVQFTNRDLQTLKSHCTPFRVRVANPRSACILHHLFLVFWQERRSRTERDRVKHWT